MFGINVKFPTDEPARNEDDTCNYRLQDSRHNE